MILIEKLKDKKKVTLKKKNYMNYNTNFYYKLKENKNSGLIQILQID